MVEVDDLEVFGLYHAGSIGKFELIGLCFVVRDIKSVEQDVLIRRVVNLRPRTIVPGIVDELVDVAYHDFVEDELRWVGIIIKIFVEIQFFGHAAVVKFSAPVLLNIGRNDVCALLHEGSDFELHGICSTSPVACLVEQFAIEPDAVTVVVKDIEHVARLLVNLVEGKGTAEPEVRVVASWPFCLHAADGSPIADRHYCFSPL